MTETALTDLRVMALAAEIDGHSSKTSASHDLGHALRTNVDPWTVVSRAINVAAEAQRKVAEQQARISRLEGLLAKDELTGLANRRGFDEAMSGALECAERHGEGGVLVFIDLDDFKDINDTFGHTAGDVVLRYVSQLLRASVRSSDTVARLGGDEFALLLLRAEQHEAWKRTRHIQQALNSAVVLHSGASVPVRASVGTTWFVAGEIAEDIIRRADEEMYRDKRKKFVDRALLN